MSSPIHTICRGCGNPITRDWATLDPSLDEYHAGCRTGYGRIPYNPPKPTETFDPFDTRGPELCHNCSRFVGNSPLVRVGTLSMCSVRCAKEWAAHAGQRRLYAEIPLTVENFARYEADLGAVRIEITREGHEALVATIGGECPHCGRAMAEGELH